MTVLTLTGKLIQIL